MATPAKLDYAFGADEEANRSHTKAVTSKSYKGADFFCWTRKISAS